MPITKALSFRSLYEISNITPEHLRAVVESLHFRLRSLDMNSRRAGAEIDDQLKLIFRFSLAAGPELHTQEMELAPYFDHKGAPRIIPKTHLLRELKRGIREFEGVVTKHEKQELLKKLGRV